MVPSFRLLTAVLACAFLGAHIYALPRSLEDIDTINFALGVESFDVVNHRPHPPGYPVFVAMAKVSTAVLGVVAPSLDRDARAAVGLAVWGIAAGAAFIWILAGFWRALGWTPAAAWFAGALAVVSPLFWFTSARPLSDAVALVAAVGVQWMLVRHGLAGRSPLAVRPLLAAAFLAGLLIGVRTQTMWLTGPLVVCVVVAALAQRSARVASAVVAASAAGCLVWAVPLVVSAGGLGAYLSVLATQGGEDFAGVEMLATSADRRLIGDALTATFIAPWRVAWLGQLVSLLAMVGLVRLGRHHRTSLLIVVAACLPYLVFHLAFQETETVRYALPIVVPMAGLATYAMFGLPVRIAVVVAAMVTIAALVTAQPSLSVYGRHVPPAFQALRAASAAASAADIAPLVVTHVGMRRAADWYRVVWPDLPVMSTRESASQRASGHFATGATAPVWLFADRRPGDVMPFDWRSRRMVREFLQESEVRYLVGQAREDDVRWWEIETPRWMLGGGWALSPDMAGITFSSGRDPRLVPADGLLRRLDVPTRVMIGGRYLDGDRPARVIADIDGREVSRWTVTPQAPAFLQWVEIPAGGLSGDGAYARLAVRVEAVDGAGQVPRVAFDQFDFAPAGEAVAGLGDGWYGPEIDETDRFYRWASSVTTVVVHGAGPMRLTLEGASPLRDFERPTTIVVSVDGREAGRIVVADDFSDTIDLPAAMFTTTPSRVTIDLDQAFVPAERGESTDQRRLGLRFFRVEVGR